MARTKKTVGSKNQGDAGDEFRYFILAFRSGMDAIENSVVSAAEIPLSILSGLGVSDETTQAARKGNRQLAHGITGTIDTIATQIAEVVSAQASIASDAVGQATRKTTRKSTKKPAAKRTQKAPTKTAAKTPTKTTAKRTTKTAAKRTTKTAAKRTTKA